MNSIHGYSFGNYGNQLTFIANFASPAFRTFTPVTTLCVDAGSTI